MSQLFDKSRSIILNAASSKEEINKAISTLMYRCGVRQRVIHMLLRHRKVEVKFAKALAERQVLEERKAVEEKK